MYAVLVIAAILLSVGPMHARTLLAALPAGIPGHQYAVDESDQSDQQTPRVQSTATRQTSRPARAIDAPASRTPALTAPAPAWTPRIPPLSLAALEHAPNAP